MASLYTLSEQFRALNMMLEDAMDLLEDEGIGEEDVQLYIDTIEALDAPLEEKIENINKFIKNITADALALKAEEERLARKRKYMENKAKRFKDYTVESLNKINKKEVGGLFGCRLQKNNASVTILDESKIPSKYRKPQPDEIDKRGLLADLKAEQVIEGAVISPTTYHVRFK